MWYINYEELHELEIFLKEKEIENSCIKYKDKNNWEENLCIFIPLDPKINKIKNGE